MNSFDVFTKPAAGGFYAMVRLARDGEARPILNSGGFPQVFTHELDAWKCAAGHLVSYINGHLVRDGEIAGATLNEAESHFNQVLRQKGKTRIISVSYKGRRPRCAKKSDA